MNSADTSRYRTAGDGIEEGAESAVDAVGIGVVKKVRLKLVVYATESCCDELRTQRGAADADYEQFLKQCSRRRTELSAVNGVAKIEDFPSTFHDRLANASGWCAAWVAQPVMTHHALPYSAIGSEPALAARLGLGRTAKHPAVVPCA